MKPQRSRAIAEGRHRRMSVPAGREGGRCPAEPPDRFFDRRDWCIAGGVFLAALAVRGIYLYQSSAFPTFLAPTVDAETYHTIAKELAQNHRVNESFFWQPFFYPFFLSIVYFFSGASIVWAKIVQIAIGSCTCALTYLLGKHLFGRRIGLLAAGMNAFYGPLIFLEGELLGDWVEAFWSVVLILLALKVRSNRNLWTSLALGLCAGLALLTRPTIAPFLIAALLWLIWTLRRLRATWFAPVAAPGCVLAGFLAVTLPVAMLNHRITGTFALLPSSGGINLYIGNNEDTGKTLAIRPGWDWQQLTAWPQREGFADPRDAGAFFYRQVSQYATGHPLSFLGGLGEKTLKFLSSREIPRNIDIYMFRAWSPLLGALVWKAGPFGFPFGVVLPLAAVGLVCRWRDIPPGAKLLLLLYPAAVILVFVTGRYRLPVIPVMLILAACGTSSLVEILRRRQWIRAGLATAGLAAVVAISTLPGPFCDEKVNFAAELNFDLGCFYNRVAQDYDKAGSLLRKAVELKADYADAYNELGNAVSSQGRLEASREFYKRAIAINPRHSMAMCNLSATEYKLGDMEASMAILRQALAFERYYPKLHFRMGVALARQGRLQEAVENYLQALKGESDSSNLFRVHAALGDALMVAGGQAMRAVAEYQLALNLAERENLPVDARSVMRYLAWLRATSDQAGARNAVEALRLAGRLVAIDSQAKYRDALPASLSVLAAACAEGGRFADALSQAKQAVAQAESAGQAELAARIRRQIEFYQAGRPYRQNGAELPD